MAVDCTSWFQSKALNSGAWPTARIGKRASNSNTFNAVTDELLVKLEREGRRDATLTKLRWLLSLARPDLGARPIVDISAAEILVPLREVEARGNYETARRLRATIGQVFRYAIVTAKAENDPTFGLRGALVAPVVTPVGEACRERMARAVAVCRLSFPIAADRNNLFDRIAKKCRGIFCSGWQRRGTIASSKLPAPKGRKCVAVDTVGGHIR
jgi:integrase